MLNSISATELLVIVAIVLLLLFGGTRIPEFFKGLGEAVKEFRKASQDISKENIDKS